MGKNEKLALLEALRPPAEATLKPRTERGRDSDGKRPTSDVYVPGISTWCRLD